MIKYFVKLGQAPDFYWSDDEWKDFVCQDFDENVVLLGNRDYSEHAEASWWKDAEEIAEQFDYCEEVGDFIANLGEYSPDKLREIWDLYQTGKYYTDDTEFLIKIAEIIYPGIHLETGTIRGSMQGDWQDYVCVADEVDTNLLEDWYFGNVYDAALYEVNTEDLDEDDDPTDYEVFGEETDSAVISDTEYWKLRSEGLEDAFKRLFNLPADADITVDEEY